ncbi:neurofilament medium polypeptide [Esox lucius]|uniref:neurofilament medium polypeptide n=1 Tax=Esox lucius TaxID=8010 RepID=UPI0014772AB7|nr:neurofilament medium polypeptide [Esox lucius]
MDSYFLIGLIFALLIHHCKAQGLSASIQPSVDVTTQGPELLSGVAVQEDVILEVASPGLREVEKAVQEVVGVEEPVGAEVLKELLERVVGAALGEVKGNVGEMEGEKAEGGQEEEVGEEEQEVEAEEEVEEERGLGQHEEVAEVVEWVKDGGEGDQTEAGEEEVGGEEVEGEIKPEHEEKEVGGVGEVEDQIVEVPVAVVEETVIEEGEVGRAEEEEGKVSEEGEGAAGKTEEVIAKTEEEVPAVTEKEEVVKMFETQGGEGLGGEEEVVEEDDYEEMKTTQSVVGERREEDGKEKGEVAGGQMEDGEEDSLERVVGEAAGEALGSAEKGGGERVGDQEGEGVDGAETAGHLGGEERGGTGEAVVEATPGPVQTDDQGEPLKTTSPISPHRPGAETVSNTMGGAEILEDLELESNDVNEIITTKEDLLNLDLGKATPTLDHFVDDVSAIAEEAEQGETNELVEVTTEPGVLGLETWKIGVISAAVFLFLEATVIIVYVIMCRNHTSSGRPAARVCEVGGLAECRRDPPHATDGACQQAGSEVPSNLDSPLNHQETVGGIQMNPPRDDPADDLVDPLHAVRTSVL